MKTASLGTRGKVIPSDHSGTFVEVRKYRSGYHLRPQNRSVLRIWKKGSCPLTQAAP